jgi:hypothetical protein
LNKKPKITNKQPITPDEQFKRPRINFLRRARGDENRMAPRVNLCDGEGNSANLA